MKPFDIIHAISESKKNLSIVDGFDKACVPFVINRGLSYFPDTILYANEMNRLHLLDNKVQFHYLLNTIRPRKRFSKWYKNELTEDIKIISEYFGYSYTKAKQVQNLISSDQLNMMKQKLQKGG
jgi:hypothetical protein